MILDKHSELVIQSTETFLSYFKIPFRFMKKSRFTLLTLLALLTCTQAQEPTARTCRVLFLERPADALKTLHLFDGITSQEVETTSMNLSPIYKVATGTLNLRILTTKVEDPKAIPPDAITVEIPETYKDFILLLSSDPNNKILQVKAQAIDTGSNKLKPGETLWVNLTTHTIEAKLGSKSITVEPQSHIVAEPPQADSGYFTAEFFYKAKDMTNFQPVMKKSWWHDTKSTNLGFIADTGNHLPKIVSFRDIRN